MLMLLFYVGTDAYACDTEEVVEIIPKIKTKTLPQMPPYFTGLINYAGTSLPVVDFCKLVANRESTNSMHSRIILFRNPFSNDYCPVFGLIAEKVIETKFFDPDSFVYSEIKMMQTPYLKGVMNTDETSIELVSIPELFNYIKGVIA